MDQAKASNGVRRGMFRSHEVQHREVEEEPADDNDDDISTDYSVDDDFGPEEEFDVEGILAETYDENGSKLYLVQWEAPRYDILESTWEPEDHIVDKTILDTWRDKKMRMLRSNEKPFDLVDFERRRDRRLKEQAEHHRRKKQKRKRLGLPVSPSESEAEDATSKANDTDSSTEAEEVYDKPHNGHGPEDSNTRAKKAERKTPRKAAAYSSNSENDEQAQARHKRRKLSKDQNEGDSSDDSLIGELTRKPRQKEKRDKQDFKEEGHDRNQIKNTKQPRHVRRLSQSSSDTPLAQSRRNTTSNPANPVRRGSASTGAASSITQKGSTSKPALQQRNSLSGAKHIQAPPKASTSGNVSRVVLPAKTSTSRGGRGAVRGGYGNVFSSRGATGMAKKKTLTDKLIETVKAPDTTKSKSHFVNMKMGWNAQKAGRQISDSAPDISALPGGLIDPSKIFQALRPVDLRKAPPVAKNTEKVQSPETLNSVSSDKPDESVRPSFYIPESRNPVKDNPYYMTCFYWHDRGSCSRQYDNANPCRFQHMYSNDIPVAPRPGSLESRSKTPCRNGPSCILGSHCEYYHPGRHNQQDFVSHPGSLAEDRFKGPISSGNKTLISPLPVQEHASTRRENGYESTSVSQYDSGPTSSTSYQSSRRLCRYHPNCLNSNCTFSHPDISSTVPQREICKFYLVGGAANCYRGDACSFLHPEDTRGSIHTHGIVHRVDWYQPQHIEKEYSPPPASRPSKRVTFADNQSTELVEEPENLSAPDPSTYHNQSENHLPQDDYRPPSIMGHKQLPVLPESPSSHFPIDVPQSEKNPPAIQLQHPQNMASAPAGTIPDRLSEKRGSTSSISSAMGGSLFPAVPSRKLTLDEYKIQQAYQATKGLIKKSTFGSNKKQSVIFKFEGLDLPLHYSWAEALGAVEQLNFSQICMAQDFQYQQTDLSYKILSQGGLLASLESIRDTDVMAEYLKAHSSGLVCAMHDFIVLLYPTRSEEWKFLESEPKTTESSIRYLICQSKEPVVGSRLSKRIRASGLTRKSGNIKKSFYLPVLASAFMKLSFSTMHPNPQVHKHPLFYIMFTKKAVAAAGFIAAWILSKRSDCKIYSSSTYGSWDYFVNAQASSKAVLFYESSVAAVSAMPFISKLIEDRAQKTSFWLIEDYSHGFSRLGLPLKGDAELLRGTTAMQIFPLHGENGGAILLTPSFIVAEPGKVVELILWFQKMTSNSPLGLWKLVCCSNIRKYLLDLAIEKACELKQFRHAHREDDAMDANALKKGLSHEKCSQRFEAHDRFIHLVSHEQSYDAVTRSDDDDLSEALKNWSGIHSRTGADKDSSSITYADSTIDGDDEKSLVSWFSEWSMSRLDVFRRFIVVGTGPEHSDKAYRMKAKIRDNDTSPDSTYNQGDLPRPISFSLKKPDTAVDMTLGLPKYGYDGIDENDEYRSSSGDKLTLEVRAAASNPANDAAVEKYDTLSRVGSGYSGSGEEIFTNLRHTATVPSGTIQTVVERCYKDSSAMLDAYTGDKVEILKHISGHMYLCQNVSTKEVGQLSDIKFEDERRVKPERARRRRRRAIQRLPTEKGSVRDFSTQDARRQVCGFYNESYCSFGNQCIRKHICCECGIQGHGARDCPGPSYEDYSDTDDAEEYSSKAALSSYDGALDSTPKLITSGIRTTTNGDKLVPLLVRSLGCTRPEKGIRPGFILDEVKQFYSNRRVLSRVPQFESEATSGSVTSNSVPSESEREGLESRIKRRKLDGQPRALERETTELIAVPLEVTTSWYEKQKAAGKAWEHLSVGRWEDVHSQKAT